MESSGHTDAITPGTYEVLVVWCKKAIRGHKSSASVRY